MLQYLDNSQFYCNDFNSSANSTIFYQETIIFKQDILALFLIKSVIFVTLWPKNLGFITWFQI